MEFAIDVARSAGDILREGYHQQKTIRLKGVRDLVTDFDLQSEEYIIEQIREKYPRDGVLAEESGQLLGMKGEWVIDPLDGTTNFAHGIPFFAISIAYVLGGEAQLGVILDPMRDECFHALPGNGAWLGDLQLQVSSTSNYCFPNHCSSDPIALLLNTGPPFSLYGTGHSSSHNE